MRRAFDRVHRVPKPGEVVAWARAWVFDPNIKKGRKLLPVTIEKCLEDDVPLYRKCES